MRYAEVAVDAPVSHSRTFSYSIPDNFSVEPGQLVWVPFGRRLIQGLVVQLSPTAQVETTRDILQPLEPSPLVSPIGLSLGFWLSRYYFCSLFECLSLLLPPGFKARVRSRVSATPAAEEESASLKQPGSWRPQTAEAMRKLANTRQMGEGEFTHLLGRNGSREVNRLVDSGLVRRQVDLPRARTFRYESYLIPAFGAADGEPAGSQKLSTRQSKLLEAVQSYNQGYPVSLANKEFGRPTSMSMVERGLLALEWIREERAPLVANNSAGSPTSPAPSLILTPMQADAVTRIIQAIDDSRAITGPNLQPGNFLLHGVTGSGKTEVYLRAMERVISAGQQTIFLVPEISLTPQTVSRLAERFPGRVAVIHSRMKAREKFDQWWQIRDGEYDVVVGPRSALFAPVPDLGLIVIDEEHEWTYKQEEAQPLYDARTAALELARLTGAVVVRGSATPDVETYYQASTGQTIRGRTRLLELPDRIGSPQEGQEEGQKPALAQVKICDMREELREGNRSIFSRELAQELKECVNTNHQAILFLNRRGSAPFVQCRDCGYVLNCRSCAVTLTFHSTIARLVCHRCNRRTRTPRRCRQCGGERIRQLGIGTQRVVDEVTGLLPGISVERWDADSSRSGTGPEQTMAGLASGEIQVLVGTQMVAKGLDLPRVTLVGAILADVGLHLPDFRAGERAFSLLCQVAGRAGRGPDPGRVIIQTYSPEHYAVAAAATQDYSAMYRREIQTRQAQGNPPFNQLAQIRFQDLSATACQRQATALARLLRQRVAARGLADVEIAGPAPGIPERIRGHYRWNLLVRGRNLHRFLEDVRLPPNGVVDLDPAHLL